MTDDLGLSASPSLIPSPSLARALARWQHAAGPYWPFVCATPFVGDVSEEWVLQVKALGPRNPRNRAKDAKGTGPHPVPLPEGEGTNKADCVHIRHAPLPKAPPPFVGEGVGGGGRPRPLTQSILDLAGDRNVAIFVDLPPARILRAAAELNHFGFYVVPIIQRWVAASAVLDCGALVARLIIEAERCRLPRDPRGAVVILDGDRAGPPRLRREPFVPRRFDNRYAYSPDRFPPPRFLQNQGITTIHWLTTANAATDLQPYHDDLAYQFVPDPQPLAPGSHDALARR